jgi:hypothetical protein
MKRCIEVFLLDEGIVMKYGIREVAFRDLAHFLSEFTSKVLGNWTSESISSVEIVKALEAAIDHSRAFK